MVVAAVRWALTLTPGTLWALFTCIALLLTGCVPQVKVGRCRGVLTAPTELVTAAHCLSPYDGGRTSIRAAGHRVQATPFEINGETDVARLTLSEPVHAFYYGAYREPTVGVTGFVLGGCPFRDGAMFRVMAAERGIGSDGIARWEWLVRDGAISCPGDSGSPVWSDTEPGIYYGVVSRFERLKTVAGGVVSHWEIGTSLYTGTGAED